MIRFGTIGTGWITAKFVRSTSMAGGFSYAAAYSRNAERARSFATGNGAPHCFTDLTEMAESPLIDAVYIASPNSLHYEQSLLFLRHGKHVLCEKSVACSPERVQTLIDTAREHHVVFMEAIMNIHLPQFELLRNTMKRIGRISMARFSFCQLSSKYPALLRHDAGEDVAIPNIFNPEFETGAAMDIGVYCVYPALALFGMPQKVEARALLHKNGIDLCGCALLGYPGMAAELSYSKVAEGRALSEIQGDNGTILIDRMSEFIRLDLVLKDGAQELLYKIPPDELAMTHEAIRFAEYITNPIGTRSGYEADCKLAVEVSGILREIRKSSGMPF